jgi:CheY-like chemotaxis protein
MEQHETPTGDAARPRHAPETPRRRTVSRRSAHLLALVTQLGLAPLTACQVAAQRAMAEDVRRPIVRTPPRVAADRPAVLIVDDEPVVLQILDDFMAYAGWRTIPVLRPAIALARLEREPRLALVTSGIRMPATRDGLDFMRAVRRRRPDLPLVVIAAYPIELVPLWGTPDCPILALTKPVRLKQIQEMLLSVLAGGTAAPGSVLR